MNESMEYDKIGESMENECWICRRTKDELEDQDVELFFTSGPSFNHTVCRVCEDLIIKLGSHIDDEALEMKIRETIRFLLQDMIESDALS